MAKMMRLFKKAPENFFKVLSQFWQKCQFSNFHQNATPETKLHAKKLANYNEQISRKMKKSPILGQKGQFWIVFGQNGQNGENYKKVLGKFVLSF